MKQLLAPLAVCLSAALAAAQATFPPTPGAGVLYSHHNFAFAGWNRPETGKPNEACGVCHIPHVENRPEARTSQTLLWGRELQTRSYVMYTSPTLQGITDSQPSGTSRMCLACHDGTVALELFHTASSGTTVFPAWHRQVIPGRRNLDFGSDHPISITYPSNDAALRPVTAPFGLVAGQTIADHLEGGKVQCVTCHDIHNREVPTQQGESYLRMTVSDPANPSAICFACHAK